MFQPFRFRRALAVALVLAAALSCSTSDYAIREDVQKGDYDSASKKLEQRAKDDPDDFDTHMELGDTYYLMARKAIDENKQAEYIELLRKAQAEYLAAARIEPDSPRPHTSLGIITAYEGDLDGSETAFRNALRLAMQDPYERGGGTYYSNLAHISVYKGNLAKARRYLSKAGKTGAPQDEIDRISVLLAWKENDMVRRLRLHLGRRAAAQDHEDLRRLRGGLLQEPDLWAVPGARLRARAPGRGAPPARDRDAEEAARDRARAARAAAPDLRAPEEPGHPDREGALADAGSGTGAGSGPEAREALISPAPTSPPRARSRRRG